MVVGMETIALQLLRFARLSERLKLELRHSWLSNGRRESVAEHTWHMALLALLVHRHLEHPVDLERTFGMVLVHDLVEAEAGDVPVFETGVRQDSKRESEAEAIRKIRDLLTKPVRRSGASGASSKRIGRWRPSW